MSHDEEGDWQFLCGEDNHVTDDAKMISLKQITEIDGTLNEMAGLPLGTGAERKSINDKWEPFRHS